MIESRGNTLLTELKLEFKGDTFLKIKKLLKVVNDKESKLIHFLVVMNSKMSNKEY